MFRWSVWFKKIPSPIITTYSRRAGWDDMRNSIRQQLSSMDIDSWMLEWAQKISTQWWVEILHEYLVWWPWYDTNTWDEVYVVVLANANKDILWIAYKSIEELWSETFYNLRNAFEMAETDMTDAIWSMCMSWFFTTLTVLTSQWVTTISDGSQSILINTTSHAMKYWTNWLWTNDTSTEYTILQTNWWLQDWTYTYQWINQDWINVSNSIKDKSKIVLTIISDTDWWYTTISDWQKSISYNTSTQWLKYNAKYYAEEQNTTALNLLIEEWRLTDWTYNYPLVSSTDINNWTTIINSVKASWISNATITHDTTNWEITIRNGDYSITIADKNLWATSVYNTWDTLSETNCGKYYQWWNNYWFAWSWTLTDTSNTKVDTSGYWPSNYYSSNIFINLSWDWSNPSNNNLRWSTTNTEVARQWPCPSWWHIPDTTEWGNLFNFYDTVFWWYTPSWSWWKTAFKIPDTWRRESASSTKSQWTEWYYWTTSYRFSWQADAAYFRSSQHWSINSNYRTTAMSIRPFKNTTPSS